MTFLDLTRSYVHVSEERPGPCELVTGTETKNESTCPPFKAYSLMENVDLKCKFCTHTQLFMY